jgi:hypothetical protein
MTKVVRKGAVSEGLRTLAAGVATGVSSLTSFGHPASLPSYPHASSMDALRSDWVRIGRDMKNVVRRENASVEKKAK